MPEGILELLTYRTHNWGIFTPYFGANSTEPEIISQAETLHLQLSPLIARRPANREFPPLNT